MMKMEEKLHPVTDWDGNVFHEGDVLQAYNLMTAKAPTTEMYFDDFGNERMRIITPEFAWRKFFEANVELKDGVLQVQIPPAPEHEGLMWVPLRMMIDMQDDQFVAFCIKGISNNEERFYKHYFKPGDN